MSDPLKSARYQSSDLRDKLAGEYVLGTLTPRVRQRLEALMRSDPTWWEHIEQWQQHLSGLSPAINFETPTDDLIPPPIQTWTKIESKTTNKQKPTKYMRWWWIPISMAFSLLLGVWLQPLVSPTSQPIEVAQVRPISYLAMMSSETQKNHFALVAYQGDQPGQSSIRMQRNLAMTKISMDRAMVWMRDGETGELKLIDSLKNVNNVRYMSPSEWKILKNSSELLVTANRDPNSEVLYRGRCVELSNPSLSQES
ncbi:hypothetical protein [Vibrio owensii]|uniref:hypothetical protein n=1 Tax=Vibrio owensii TaxID=696485 RepID=UPI000998A7D9|nr:hypothetical protein [Vibrio owensii]AQW58027.1 hypothetical protein A9237_07775 [Vibrio owensii]